MESCIVFEKEEHLFKGSSDNAAAECRSAAASEKMGRHCSLQDGSPHSHSRQLQHEAQQSRRSELTMKQYRQQKHIDQQNNRHAFEQTRRKQLHVRQKRRQSQQRTQQQERPIKLSPSHQKRKQSPTQQHLPQGRHFFRQYKHERRHSARLLSALLLLILPRVPVQRSSAELSCSIFFVSLPASGAVAVTDACANLPQTEKQLESSPVHTSRPAAPAGAIAARRLADEKSVRREQTERVDRRDIGALSKGGQAKVKKPSHLADEQEEGRGAEEAASPAPPGAGGFQRSTKLNASSTAAMKEKADRAAQRVHPQEPSAVTKKKVETSTVYERGIMASPGRDKTADAAADKGAGKEIREDEKAQRTFRSHGAAAPSGSARAEKGMEKAIKNEVAPEVFGEAQRILKSGNLQQKTIASVHEQKGKDKRIQQHTSPFGTRQKEPQLPAARDRVEGLHVLMSGSTMPVDADTLPRTASGDSSSLLSSSDATVTFTGGSRTSASSSASLSEPTSSSVRELGSKSPGIVKSAPPVKPLPDSVAAENTREVPASNSDAALIPIKSSNLDPTTPITTGNAGGAQLLAGGGESEGSSSSELLHTQIAKGTGSAGEIAQNYSREIRSAGEDAVESAKKAPEEPAAVRERLVEQRVAALEEQTRSAERLIQAAAKEQQRLFKTFEERFQGVTKQLTAVETRIEGLSQMLSNVGEHLARERERQESIFHEDIQRSIAAVGLNSAALRQAELSGKLNALQGMHDTLMDKMQSVAQSLQTMEENRQARLEMQTQQLQKFVEGRTSLAIAQLVAEAKQCAAGMQQQLNDAKLDQILLTQAAKEAEERLREQKFAAVDISHVDEKMSFQGITSAFAALLQATFPGKDLVLIYFVTVRPQTLAHVAYSNVFLVPSAENTRRLLSVVAADPSLSEMVVKVESIMAEAWRTSPQRAHMQYLMPTPQEGLRMAGSVEYVYEFMKIVHKVTQEKHLSGEMIDARPAILIYTGMRQGVEAPADTPHTEFKKLQILRNLVTMYTSPVQETVRLWQIMKNEVHLLDIFAPLQPIEVDGCHLRVYGGVAPLPEIPNSPFIKGGITFVRLQLTRSGTRYFLFPNPGLWLKILQYLTLVDTTNLGTFAVVKARVAKMSWIRSRMQRLFQSLPRAELSVYVHDYHRTTQPSELQAVELKGSRGKPDGASSELHKGLAEAVESVTDTLAQSVLPHTARKGFSTRRHLFVHVCESDVSCGTQESP